MNDGEVVVIGGGVIGLSIAWELARRGRRVRLLERGELGREASWAGAGMLPVAPASASDPLEQLTALSVRLHPQWARQLLDTTGIDNGYRVCGALYVARSAGERASLRAWQRSQQQQGLEADWLGADEVARLEPQLTAVLGACRLPGEAQLRNPRHLRALAAACQSAGVELLEHCEVRTLDPVSGRLRTSDRLMSPEQVCVTAGPWSRTLLADAPWKLDVFPVRGQMVLFRTPEPLLSHTINEGPRYLVPRDDGRLLAGSTEEEVGFDKSTTEGAIGELGELARGLLPALANAEVERTWAGLRPASFDGFPYLGRAPESRSVFVATGHFRSGLTWSTGTATLMAQLMCGERPEIDMRPFHVGR